jgi:ATP-dependent exoDNAse (exonuclease V) beta subunit
LHHRFLQHVALEAIVADEPSADELARLQASGVFTAEEAAALDLEQLNTFWRGRLGQRILAEAPNVERELPFTARFSPAELLALGIPVTPGLSPDDYVVTQGIVDLAVIRERELWLVDFKTDAISPRDLSARAEMYGPQIKLYAIALERIHRRPVTERWLHFLHLGKSVAIS